MRSISECHVKLLKTNHRALVCISRAGGAPSIIIHTINVGFCFLFVFFFFHFQNVLQSHFNSCSLCLMLCTHQQTRKNKKNISKCVDNVEHSSSIGNFTFYDTLTVRNRGRCASLVGVLRMAGLYITISEAKMS